MRRKKEGALAALAIVGVVAMMAFIHWVDLPHRTIALDDDDSSDDDDSAGDDDSGKHSDLPPAPTK